MSSAPAPPPAPAPPCAPRMISLINYVEITEEIDKTVYLSIGVIEGTDNIRIDRFEWVREITPDDLNIGSARKNTLSNCVIEYGWKNVSKDETIPLRRRYMELIETEYYKSTWFRKNIHPVVKDFVKPVPKGDYHRSMEDEEYHRSYYGKRMSTYEYFKFTESDSDDDYGAEGEYGEDEEFNRKFKNFDTSCYDCDLSYLNKKPL